MPGCYLLNTVNPAGCSPLPALRSPQSTDYSEQGFLPVIMAMLLTHFDLAIALRGCAPLITVNVSMCPDLSALLITVNAYRHALGLLPGGVVKGGFSTDYSEHCEVLIP